MVFSELFFMAGIVFMLNKPLKGHQPISPVSRAYTPSIAAAKKGSRIDIRIKIIPAPSLIFLSNAPRFGFTISL